MAVQVPPPVIGQKAAEKDGQMSRELLELLQRIKEKLDDHETRLTGGGL